MRNGKPAHRNHLINDTDYTIVDRYQAEFRGVQYYLLAYNVFHFGKLQWVMGKSLAKTLATSTRPHPRLIFRRYKSTVQTAHGERACLEVVEQQGEGKRPLVARFGGIPLKRNRQAVPVDRTPTRYRTERNELVKRLLANECEMCGSTVGVHHIRALRDLTVKGRPSGYRSWRPGAQVCHLNAHGSWAQATQDTGEPDDAERRFGGGPTEKCSSNSG